MTLVDFLIGYATGAGVMFCGSLATILVHADEFRGKFEADARACGMSLLGAAIRASATLGALWPCVPFLMLARAAGWWK